MQLFDYFHELSNLEEAMYYDKINFKEQDNNIYKN